MIVVTLGARTVEGAVQAGLAFAFVPEILKALGLSPAYQFILFGLGAITYARHPEGIVEYNKRRSLDAVQRFLTRGRTPPPGEHGDAVVAARPTPATVAPASAGNPGTRAVSLLEASGVCKRFSGITALDDVSITVEPGEPVGLIGPNGAGKTTFFNCLLGHPAIRQGPRRVQRARHHPHAGVQAGSPRLRSHVPAHRAVHRG